MLEAAYLCLGKIAPDWQQLELHVGGATVASAVSEATGVTRWALCVLAAAQQRSAGWELHVSQGAARQLTL
jgi:hypothetical protein